MRLRLQGLSIPTLFTLLAACTQPAAPAENQAPTVRLSEPLQGAMFSQGSTINIRAEASDPDNNLSHVTFYVDGTEVGAYTAAPYIYAFTPSAAKQYVLAAKAQDDEGATSTAASATVQVRAEDKLYSLDVAVTGEGSVGSAPVGIDCPGTCAANFTLGQEVILAAAPVEGSSLVSWGGACSGTEPTCTIPAENSSDLSVSASFEPRNQNEVTVTLNPPSADTTTSESVTFTATVTGSSDTGVTWSSTGGTVAGNGNEAIFSASAAGNYTVTAASTTDPGKFADATVNVTLAENPNAPFSIVALPDTQNYLCSSCRDNPESDNDFWHPEYFRAQTQWIVDNVETRNIRFATFLGDIVENASKEEETRLADEAVGLLGGALPYAVPPGDHDYYPEQVHTNDYSRFVRYFGKDRYKIYDWYGGAGPRELSHYQMFTGGGYTFLHIALEWEAPDDTLAWANGIIADNPGLPTVISTHAYLNDATGRRQPNPDDYACSDDDESTSCLANSAEEIFQELVKPNPQVFMVLNAHYHASYERYDKNNPRPTAPSDNGEYWQVSQNIEGSDVYEMLSNYQDYQQGGDGWLRILTFEPGGGEGGLDRIQVETYSPVMEQQGKEAYQHDDMGTQSASEFYFDLDFDTRFGAP